MFKVKKHKSLIPDEKWEIVHSDMQDLHYSVDEKNFDKNKKKVFSKWKKTDNLDNFVAYFEKQWY